MSDTRLISPIERPLRVIATCQYWLGAMIISMYLPRTLPFTTNAFFKCIYTHAYMFVRMCAAFHVNANQEFEFISPHLNARALAIEVLVRGRLWFIRQLC